VDETDPVVAPADTAPSEPAQSDTPHADPATRAPRVRWWRRQPPPDLPPFARGVWWTGHVQLFLAIAAVVLGPIAFVVGSLLTSAPAPLGSPMGSMLNTFGLCLTATALPLVLSGLLLRRYSRTAAATTGSSGARGVKLALVIIAIAVVAIILTSLIVTAILFALLSISCQNGC
jgi:hypothetical protein